MGCDPVRALVLCAAVVTWFASPPARGDDRVEVARPLDEAAALQPDAAEDEPILSFEYEGPDEALVEALGLRVFRFRLTAPPGYMINVEPRFFKNDKLDRRSRGSWYLSSEGFDGHEVFIGVLDPDAMHPDRHTADIKFVGSDFPPQWFKLYKRSGMRRVQVPETASAGEDVTVLEIVYDDAPREPVMTEDVIRPKGPKPDPAAAEPEAKDDEEGEGGVLFEPGWWLDNPDELKKIGPLRLELVVRAEPVTDAIRARFRPFLTLRKSGLESSYFVKDGRRFFPWDEEEKEAAPVESVTSSDAAGTEGGTDDGEE